MNILVSISTQPLLIKSLRTEVSKKKYKFQVNTANIVSSTRVFIANFESLVKKETFSIDFEESPFQNHVNCIKKVIE